ncbi:hypothetical protein D9757_012904 [Collybiopsis confluens]|uniref:Uncharacterized protein n=1 Tax=Collybiopsis confluens TaxID=2823264 RepID=A0A8H5FZN4_9AGAR|nr:hypothetical protein D9757_012904 [Collybiopsis confluens]
MSSSHQQSSSSSSSAPTTFNEPPWTGWIETTGDALLILEAARRGLIPRVTRRLVDSERRMISSGSVFVFDEEESGIKRWTDGFFWSPSRILGNFLLYRETDKRGPSQKGSAGRYQQEDSEESGTGGNGGGNGGNGSTSLSRPKTESSSTPLGIDKFRERSLVGSLTNSPKFKSDGLMKKTFSLNIDGVAQHLISYYRIGDVENGRLRSPSSLPELASLDISPEFLDKTHFRNPPKVEIGPDGVPRYRGEADEVESAAPTVHSPSPLSNGLPLLSEGRSMDPSNPSKQRRFQPYVTTQVPSSTSSTSPSATSPIIPKRHRKRTTKSPSEDGRSSSQPPTPTSATLPPLPLPSSASEYTERHDPNMSAVYPSHQHRQQSMYTNPAYYTHPHHYAPQPVSMERSIMPVGGGAPISMYSTAPAPSPHYPHPHPYNNPYISAQSPTAYGAAPSNPGQSSLPSSSTTEGPPNAPSTGPPHVSHPSSYYSYYPSPYGYAPHHPPPPLIHSWTHPTHGGQGHGPPAYGPSYSHPHSHSHSLPPLSTGPVGGMVSSPSSQTPVHASSSAGVLSGGPTSAVRSKVSGKEKDRDEEEDDDGDM